MYRAPLIFGVVVLTLIIGVILLFGGHGKKTPVTNPIQPLPSYATTDATVSMTIDGPVNGDESHRQVKITIGADSRDLDIIQGYSGRVIKNKPFYNTQDAYRVFLKSIANNGFLVKRKNVDANLDYEGQCALGDRFIFELDHNGTTLSRLWTSSCGSSIGNLGVNSSNLQALFEAQITDFETLTENVNLGL